MKRFVCFPVQTEILIFSYRVSIRWNNFNFLNLVYQPSIILVSKKKRNKTEKNGFEHKKNNQQMFFFVNFELKESLMIDFDNTFLGIKLSLFRFVNKSTVISAFENVLSKRAYLIFFFMTYVLCICK